MFGQSGQVHGAVSNGVRWKPASKGSYPSGPDPALPSLTEPWGQRQRLLPSRLRGKTLVLPTIMPRRARQAGGSGRACRPATSARASRDRGWPGASHGYLEVANRPAPALQDTPCLSAPTTLPCLRWDTSQAPAVRGHAARAGGELAVLHLIAGIPGSNHVSHRAAAGEVGWRSHQECTLTVNRGGSSVSSGYCTFASRTAWITVAFAMQASPSVT